MSELLQCSFCGKSQGEVRKLVAGPSVFICNECIGLCNDIVDEERPVTAPHEPTREELREQVKQYFLAKQALEAELERVTAEREAALRATNNVSQHIRQAGRAPDPKEGLVVTCVHREGFLTGGHRLGAASGVYTIFTQIDCYVGKSTNIAQRLTQHLKSKGRAWEMAFVIKAGEEIISSLETWTLRQVLRAGLPVSNAAPTARLPGNWRPPAAVCWDSAAMRAWDNCVRSTLNAYTEEAAE